MNNNVLISIMKMILMIMCDNERNDNIVMIIMCVIAND